MLEVYFLMLFTNVTVLRAAAVFELAAAWVKTGRGAAGMWQQLWNGHWTWKWSLPAPAVRRTICRAESHRPVQYINNTATSDETSHPHVPRHKFHRLARRRARRPTDLPTITWSRAELRVPRRQYVPHWCRIILILLRLRWSSRSRRRTAFCRSAPIQNQPAGCGSPSTRLPTTMTTSGGAGGDHRGLCLPIFGWASFAPPRLGSTVCGTRRKFANVMQGRVPCARQMASSLQSEKAIGAGAGTDDSHSADVRTSIRSPCQEHCRSTS